MEITIKTKCVRAKINYSVMLEEWEAECKIEEEIFRQKNPPFISKYNPKMAELYVEQHNEMTAKHLIKWTVKWFKDGGVNASVTPIHDGKNSFRVQFTKTNKETE